MKRALIYLLVWTASALAIGLFLGSFNLIEFRAPASDGVKARGIVLSLEPQNHRVVNDAYRVGESVHRGSGTLGRGNPSFESFAPGDAVLVHDARANPASSVLGDPHARLRNEVESVSIPAVLFPSILVLGLARRRRCSGARKWAR